MKRWQKAVLTVLSLITFVTLWLLDAFTAANAHRLWRSLLLAFTVLALPAPLIAAGYAAYRHRRRWFRYALTGVLAAACYPFLNLVLFLTGLASGGTYPFIPAASVFLVGTPPEAAPTTTGLTFLFVVPAAIRVLPLLTASAAHHYALDGRDRKQLLTILALPLLIAVFWLLTLAATLAGLCVPVCGLPQ